MRWVIINFRNVLDIIIQASIELIKSIFIIIIDYPAGKGRASSDCACAHRLSTVEAPSGCCLAAEANQIFPLGE